MSDSLRTVTSYLRRLFADPDDVARRVDEVLRGVEYDTLVGVGLSGGLAAFYVANRLGKHGLVVRKPETPSHGSFVCEGTLGKRWVFLDDMIDTGASLAYVRGVVDAHVTHWGPPHFTTTYLGHVTYHITTTFVREPRRTVAPSLPL